MSEQTISHNLKTLLKLRGDITLSDLAREIGVPQPTLHHIVEGRTKKPRRQALESLARYFAISYIEAMGGELSITVKFPHRPPIKVTGFEDIGLKDAS